jgi:hypothetical protein
MYVTAVGTTNHLNSFQIAERYKYLSLRIYVDSQENRQAIKSDTFDETKLYIVLQTTKEVTAARTQTYLHAMGTIRNTSARDIKKRLVFRNNYKSVSLKHKQIK